MEPRGGTSEPDETLGFDLEFPAVTSILSEVRQLVARLSLPAPLLENARLLVNELVSNSIRHAGLGPEDRIRVSARVSRRRLRVDVFDGGPGDGRDGIAGGIRPAPGASSGWGLYLIDRLASGWGQGRGRYWFELELNSGDEPKRS
jgi:anti-sigma regulatory factor (Ser/Thr protein kinase)